jgi:hypothetical protein
MLRFDVSLYQVILGDSGPDMTMQLTFDDAPLVLNASTDTVTMRYLTPGGNTLEVALEITNATLGNVKRSIQTGDFPDVGPYQGQVTVARTGDTTFPRTFPNTGAKMIWWVHEKI